MRDEKDVAGMARDLVANTSRPLGQIGAFPVALDHADGFRHLRFEPGLPMARAARIEAGNDQGCRHAHVFLLIDASTGFLLDAGVFATHLRSEGFCLLLASVGFTGIRTGPC